MVGVTVRAHDIFQLLYAVVVQVIDHRVRCARLACVDEHILPAAADKLAVALTDIDVMHIKAVHGDGDLICVILHTLEHENSDDYDGNDDRKDGIALCKAHNALNITFSDACLFPAHVSLQSDRMQH